MVPDSLVTHEDKSSVTGAPATAMEIPAEMIDAAIEWTPSPYEIDTED